MGDDRLESKEELKRNRKKSETTISGKEGYRYCVLYAQVLKQWEVYEVIRKSLPEGRGTVFYPCVELWWNDTVNTVIRPLFPGYVFIRSDMGRAELHDLIVTRKRDILSFVKELKLAEQKNAGGVSADMDDALLIDLSEDEAEFLDFMLNFRYEIDTGKEGLEGISAIAGRPEEGMPVVPQEENRGKRKAGKIPKEGVIRMSYGYCENGKCVVMEGPLKGYEDRIVKVDRRKKKAYLDLEINGHMAKAGLELKGKGYWFPKDGDASTVLEDGTEIDPVEIARRMMAGKT